MAESIVNTALQWLVVAIIVIAGLNIITTMITGYCKTNQLFCTIVFGSVLSAIVLAAIKIIKKSTG